MSRIAQPNYSEALKEIRKSINLEPRLQKARISRNPKTNQKVNTPEKRPILFRESKEWSKKINEKT